MGGLYPAWCDIWQWQTYLFEVPCSRRVQRCLQLLLCHLSHAPHLLLQPARRLLAFSQCGLPLHLTLTEAHRSR